MTTGAYRMVVAVLPPEKLAHVQKALQDIHVGGLSVTRGKGYGEYRDYFAPGWLEDHARLEILLDRGGARPADRRRHPGQREHRHAGDGIVAVVPLENVWRVRSRALADPDEL